MSPAGEPEPLVVAGTIPIQVSHVIPSRSMWAAVGKLGKFPCGHELSNFIISALYESGFLITVCPKILDIHLHEKINK